MRTPHVTQGGRAHRTLRWLGMAAVVLFALGAPLYFPAFRVFQFSLVLVYAVAALGLNLLTGYSGQISLAQAAFLGVGAYTTAILAQAGWHPLATIPVAGAVAFVLGVLVGIPASRLRGLYLALVTLAVGVAFVPLTKKWEGLTGGFAGLTVDPIEAPAWTGLARDQWIYYTILAVAVVMFLWARALVNGRIGRALVASKEDELAASTMGVDIGRVKIFAFGYSALFGGIAGSLYVLPIGYIAPESFGLLVAVSFLAAIVVGGLGTIWGALLGAVFIRFAPVIAGDIDPAIGGMLYGVAIVLVVLLLPDGIVGLGRRIRRLVIREPHERDGAHGRGEDVEPTARLGSGPVGTETTGATERG